jgi:integrase
MASIRKHKDGYRAEVYIKGRRDSKVCSTKREATTWAISREAELQGLAGGQSTTHTLHQAFTKFAEEVSPDRRGTRWETIRLDALAKQIDNKKIAEVTPDDLNDWRKERLREVKPGTVLREIALLSAVFEAARLDWKWIRVNPVGDMRKPPKPAHRDRLLAWREIRGILRALEHTRRPRTVSQAVGAHPILPSGARCRITQGFGRF